MYPAQKMGVINLTPDSFSDGQENLNSDFIKEKIIDLNSWCDIIDFGAQSTAPFNEQISIQEEISRVEKFLIPNLQYIQTKRISIDTFYPEVFDYTYKQCKALSSPLEIIYNDVSGIISPKLIELMHEKDDFKYVLTSNFISKTDEVLNHMEYCFKGNDEQFLDEAISDVKKNLEKLKGFEDRVIIDPGFGFAKTRSQNQFLIKHLNSFTGHFENFQILVGISRKSFLREPMDLDAKDKNNQLKLDAINAMIIYEWDKKITTPIIHRLHTNLPFELIDFTKKLL